MAHYGPQGDRQIRAKGPHNPDRAAGIMKRAALFRKQLPKRVFASRARREVPLIADTCWRVWAWRRDESTDEGIMATAPRKPDPVTITAFDAFIEAKTDGPEYELVEGVIVMMSNPTETHEQIAANIGAPLNLAVDDRGCRTYQGGMRIQRSDDKRETDKARPDVVVRCGSGSINTYITDPLVVIEVLSPSTIDVDRGAKLDFYKSRPSVRSHRARLSGSDARGALSPGARGI